jgi:tRNA pseudouridine38-40 synthase
MNLESNYYYKLILSYKGTNYSGWQFQTANSQTIQNYVEKVLRKIANYQEFQVIGASRTDTGVHAKGQTLKVTLPREIEPDKLLLGMNSKLPDDIRVLECQFVDKSFNVNRDVKSKEYHYYFSLNKVRGASLSEIILYQESDLNIDLMREACELIVGEHDFNGLCTGGEGFNTIRNINYCSIEETSFLPFEDKIFYLKIGASGFLKYMVRLIMGELLQVGLGELSLKDFSEIINSGNSRISKVKAAPHGLHLMNINY